MALTEAQEQTIAEAVAREESLRSVARILGVAHTTVSRALDASPELRRKVAAARRAEAKRAKRAVQAEARAIRRLHGETSAMQPEHAPFGGDSRGTESARRSRHADPGDQRAVASGYDRGARLHPKRGSNGGGRVLVAAMIAANGGDRARGGSTAPLWWLDRNAAEAEARANLIECRVRGEDGVEVDHGWFTHDEAQALLADGWETL